MTGPGATPKGGVTARIYRDAWAFLREAEACVEEGRRRRAQACARAAVLHAAVAAEVFLEGVVARVEVDPGLDSKVEAALRDVQGEVARSRRVGGEWRRLSAAQEALTGLASFPEEGEGRGGRGTGRAGGAGGEPASFLADEIRKRRLDLAIEHCREDLRARRRARELDRLVALRAEMGKRSLKWGPLAKRWFEGATGWTPGGPEAGEEIRDFRRIVLKARGEDASEEAQGVTVEEARLACGAVRSLIASFCGAAGREVPQWVREIHDRL